MSPVDGRDLSYRACRCGQCGFGYAADLAQPATYEAYYRELSKYDVPRMGDFPSVLERRRASMALAICRPHISRDAAIADIGCGRGALLHVFHEAGYTRVHGLDPAPASAASLGIGPVLQGTISDAPARLPLADMELVCLTGVLEHLPELRHDMKCLTAALAPHARILIEVPALERFVRAQMEPFGELSLEHLQYFSRASLVRLMADIGYFPLATEIVSLHGACDSLFGLFSRTGVSPHAPEDGDHVDGMLRYIETSSRQMADALASVAAASDSFALYGAGSHSARLMPMLEDIGLLERVSCVVDGNPNLHGKMLGSFPVLPPETLDSQPDLPVLVSSFHAQTAIARSLSAANPHRPLLLLYSANDEH
jgi:SAM-dependent methyltransferase